MLVRIRLTVPDRPGSLGAVTSTLGAAGADVVQVEVLSAEGGQAVDDVHARIADATMVKALRQNLSALPGVTVQAIQHPAPPVTGHAELELVGRLVAAPARTCLTLADGAPAAFGADWAQILSYPDALGLDAGGPGQVLAASITAPDGVGLPGLPLRLATPRLLGPDGTPFGGVAVAPLTQTVVLLLVREQGPAFHRSELWRLAEITRVAGLLLDQGGRQPAEAPVPEALPG